MPSLRIQLPGKDPATYRLHKNVTVLGSGAACDLVLGDPSLPDASANLVFDGQVYELSTLAKNVEFTVGGKRRRKHKLAHRDRIQMGSVELTFSIHDESPTTPTPSGPEDELAAYRRLHEFSSRLMQKHEVPELLEELMDRVVEITGAGKGFLLLMQGEAFDIKVARNLRRENITDAVSHLSDAIVAKVVRGKEPVIISDAMHDAEFASSRSVMNLKLTSVMCVPLLDRGTLLGLIYVGNDVVTRLFEPRALQVLMVFAAQASLILRNALAVNALELSHQALTARLESLRYGALVGSSPPMQEIYRKIEKIAATDVSVLVTGETGTGKELIARELHARSPRKKGPFLSLNCGAIPESLLESELFGHVRGAFTGAVADRDGLFQAASGGTLFLDEIGEMPMALQVKLLRALQERVVVRVGENRPQSVDIRVIAATHRELDVEIAAGRFREDLYYRLNVIQLHLPPLRDRGDDVLVIARTILAKLAPEHGDKVRGFDSDAQVALRRYPWPGNIRELENRLRKALVLADHPLLGPSDLGLGEHDIPPILSLVDAKDKFQREYINQVLAQNGGNRTKTARELGVDPRTIFRHLEKEGGESGDDA